MNYLLSLSLLFAFFFKGVEITIPKGVEITIP